MSSSRSHKSTSSFVTRSTASRSSSKSKVAAEAAALKAKLKYLDVESKARLELERIQTQRDIAIAEAALNSYEGDHCSAKKEIDLTSDLENIQNRNEYVRDYVNQMPDAETLSLLPQTTVPPPRQFDIPHGSTPSSVQNPSSSQQQSDIVNLAQTLLDQMNLTAMSNSNDFKEIFISVK
ncbi:hypothetical protein SNE40_003005 [Patella caerulea]|uniref:Uncharacterized protein n=1 Tax=Patella caerulea TaxID=87958 RepID=A0AAN8KF52_PATCE